MHKIKYCKKVYAIVDSPRKGFKRQQSIWYGSELESLQASQMDYHSGKSFKVHQHKLNPRKIGYTQEALIVIYGKIEVSVYNEHHALLEKVILKAGDIILLYRGYHGLVIVNDNSIFYEIKAGKFTSVEEDKEFI